MHRPGSPARSALAVALILSISFSASAGTAAGSPAAGASPSPAAAVAGPTASSWNLSGGVVAYTGAPVSGSDVVVAHDCPAYPDANDYQGCTTVASSTTNASGEFTVAIPAVKGGYWIYNEPVGEWGGNYAYLAGLSGSESNIELRVFPYQGYGNATFVLPNYASLSAYAYQNDCDDCNYQDPILSWTGDGVFYVTTSDQVVYYDLANRSTQVIAKTWTPLYQQIMNYGGMEDTEFVTQDSSWVYTAGCVSACTDSSSIEFEAVNVTTGRIFTHTFSGFTVADLVDNFQFNMISYDGNYSTAVAFDQNGNIYLWNLWTNTASTSGTLPFFEANNVYWIPSLNAFFDQSCGGSTNDQTAEWAFNGASLKQVAEVSWYPPGGVQSNGLGGPMYNLTAHDIIFQAGYARGNEIVVGQIPVAPDGIIQTVVNYTLYSDARYPTLDSPNSAQPMTPNHRFVETAWGATVSSMYSPMFTNSSWAANMQTGVAYSTNATIGVGEAAGDVGGYFYNASYILAPTATYCDGTADSPIFGGSLRNWTVGDCPLLGTYPGAAVGTVWWLWQIGLSEFPYPNSPSIPIAQATAPETPLLRVTSNSSESISLAWSDPPGDPEGYPIMNYTLFWGTSPDSRGHSVSLPPQVTSYTLRDVTSGTSYYFSLESLNQHWFSAPAVVEANATSVPIRPLEPPTDFTVHAYGTTFINYSWRDSNPDANTTFFLSLGNSTPESFPLGTQDWFNATGLAPATTYGASLEATNATEISNRTALLYQETRANPVVPLLALTDFRTTGVGSDYVALAWENPNGPTDVSLVFGPDGATPGTTPIGAVLTYNVTGLSPSTAYSAQVFATSGTSISNRTAPINVTTLAVPLPPLEPPTDLRAVSFGPTYIDLAWTNPNPDSNVTVNVSADGGPVTSLPVGPTSGDNLTGLATGSVYALRVTADRGASSSPSSAPLYVVAAGPSANGPTQLAALASGNTSLLLSWSDPGGPLLNATIFVGHAHGVPYEEVSAGPVRTARLGGLVASSTYYVAVATWGSSGESPLSGWISAATGGASPSNATSSSAPDPWTSVPVLAGLGLGAATVLAVVVVLLLRRRPGRSTTG